jgi:hypothetical protein
MSPCVRHPTARLDALRANPHLATTIQTEGFPLSARSSAALTVTGLLVGLGTVLRSTAATNLHCTVVAAAEKLADAIGRGDA